MMTRAMTMKTTYMNNSHVGQYHSSTAAAAAAAGDGGGDAHFFELMINGMLNFGVT
jgi:hypothetical protein